MLIAKVENDQVLDVADYRAMFPDTSFGVNGPDDQFLTDNGCLRVTLWKPYDASTEKLVAVAPYIEDGQVFTIEVEPLTEEELLQIVENKANEVRQQRNTLLAESDWTQVADAPVDKTVWAIYRQELRDVTNQEGFPFDIVWPSTP